MARRAPAALLSRFTLGAPTSAPPPAPVGLHVAPEGDSYTLRDGFRWVADFETAGAAQAGLEVERRRRDRRLS